MFVKPPAAIMAREELDEALRQHLLWSTQLSYAKHQVDFYGDQISRLRAYVEQNPEAPATQTPLLVRVFRSPQGPRI